jgi:hypothetical protein
VRVGHFACKLSAQSFSTSPLVACPSQRLGGPACHQKQNSSMAFGDGGNGVCTAQTRDGQGQGNGEEQMG